jgi:D-erythronate 2-dehydrogenase
MHVLMTGAAGMIGRKLAGGLVKAGSVAGRPVDALTLVDVVRPTAPEGFSGSVNARACDIAAPGEAEALIARRPDLVFHLAAVVSGEAETNFDKGYRINLDATRHLFEAIRAVGDGYKPRVVFASSLAVFGAPFPDRIGDDFAPAPLTSYGTQKAMDELLLADYSRKGFLDGVGLRLPTICIRPGAPNKAASGFFSNILREPLVGKEAVLPVSEDTRHWHASPRAAVGFFLRAATMNLSALGGRRSLNMPGLSATVAEQIAALARIAGPKAVALIRREHDPLVETIVSGWPRDFDARRARDLGFRAETTFDEIIRIHIEDELGGRIG